MGIKLSGLHSGLDTDAIVKELMSAHSLKLTKVKNKKTKNEWKKDKWQELNKKIYALYTGDLTKAKTKGSYNTKGATCSNSSAVSVTATNNAPAGSHTIEVKELASAQYITGAKVTTLKSSSDKLGLTAGKTITIKSAATPVDGIKLEVNADTTVDDFIGKCKEAGLNATFDKNQGRFFISSKESGVEQSFTIEDDNSGTELEKLGLGNITKSNNSVVCSNSATQVTAAKDAEFVLDGATITASSNETEVNGLKLSLKEKTTGVASITVTNDTQAVYDMVKGFIKTYNDVLEAMNKAYYADTAKGYEPLTDEEREAMTEDQIKKWETKIQDSLLRRDSTLGSLLTSFKSVMSSPTSVKDKNGNPMSLSSLGIGTSSDYSEKGLLHIHGDSEDKTYADKENKLMKMIEEDPDTVASIIQETASKLYDMMSSQMKSTPLSSALTFYNDKQIDKNTKQYEADIKKMENKLKDLENKYYKQFSAMEAAMAKLNSQQSSLASLLA